MKKIIAVFIGLILLTACAPQIDNGGVNTPAPTLSPTLKPEPSSSPTAEPHPSEEALNPDDANNIAVLESLSLDEKIGQLLLVGYPSDEAVEEVIKNHKAGGIVLFSRNYNTFDELHSLTQRLKELNSLNKLPIWIALDEEGGTVSRLPKGKTPVPGARQVGLYNDLSITRATGIVIGEEMVLAGTNLDLAPVMDIVQNPENKFMIKRSYGSTTEMVSDHSIAFLEGLEGTGITGCAKHFPGHGDTVVDSHTNMPVINKTLDEWRKHEAVPFLNAIEAGVEMIMVGHLAYPKIDPTGVPSSMSKVFLSDILRGEMGYNGVVITDDLEMLGYPQGEDMKKAVVTSFLAGVDVFAIGHTPEVQLRVLSALKEAVEAGEITIERVDESVLRIIRLKNRLNKMPEYSLETAKHLFGSEEHRSLIAPLLNAD